MPNAYTQDVKATVDALSTDEGLSIEGRLISLDMMKHYLTAVRSKLESDLSMETNSQAAPAPQQQN